MNATRPLINARTACPSSRSKSQPYEMPVPQHCGTGISVCAAFRLQTLFTPYVRRSAHFSGGQLRRRGDSWPSGWRFLPYFFRGWPARRPASAVRAHARTVLAPSRERRFVGKQIELNVFRLGLPSRSRCTWFATTYIRRTSSPRHHDPVKQHRQRLQELSGGGGRRPSVSDPCAAFGTRRP